MHAPGCCEWSFGTCLSTAESLVLFNSEVHRTSNVQLMWFWCLQETRCGRVPASEYAHVSWKSIYTPPSDRLYHETDPRVIGITNCMWYMYRQTAGGKVILINDEA